MKLDPDLFRYLTKEHFRMLTAVEMGMRNHEFVPVPLIEKIAALKRSNTYKLLQLLLKHKLVMHQNKQYDGYALTNMGYDYLALKAFFKRGTVSKVLLKVGVGKESDIYLCETPEEERVVIKFARLGRTSFRTIKNNRDYLKNKSLSSWLYLSRIASLKEYAFMKCLYEHGFPTPVPIDANRHGIVMSYIDAFPMTQVRALEMKDAKFVYEQLMKMVIQLAEHGLVHGDFNEFNLMLNGDTMKVTMIDFPQMISTSHPNAEYYFDRDVRCVQDFFTKRFGLQFEGKPQLETDIKSVGIDLDKEVRASGFLKEELGEGYEAALELVNVEALDKEREEQGEAPESDQEEEEGEEEEKQEAESGSDQGSEEEPESGEEKESKSGDEEEEVEEEKDRKVKVKFAEEVQAEKGEEPAKEGEEDESEKVKTKKVINEKQIKERAKKQYKSKQQKQQSKRNRNKDKKVMKANETIKDYFGDF